MDRSAIILAGGCSSRFGQDKSILKLKGKPLIKHVIDAVKQVVNEVIVVTNTQEHADIYAAIIGANVKFAIDIDEAKGPLVGAVTGFEQASGKYSLLLPSDMPFVSRDVIELLFDLAPGKSAVIPRWSNTEIEPLHAIYNTETALEAAKMAINDNKLKMSDMLDNMQGVRYISTMVLQELDAELKTFFNVNTPVDLKKAEVLTKPRPQKTKQK